MSQAQKPVSNIRTINRIIAAARAYKGAPWKHEGRSINGLDCAGLVICTGRDCGLFPPDFDVRNYRRTPLGYRSFIDYFDKNLVKKMNNQAAAGDIVIVKDDTRYAGHCGILGFDVAELSFIHATLRHGVTLEQPFESDGWRQKHVATYSYPESCEW